MSLVSKYREDDPAYNELVLRLDAALTKGLGVSIGVNDRDGNPVHIGDTLEFDPKEWFRGVTAESGVVNLPPPVVIELVKGEIVCNGGVGSIPDWCRIVKGWDEA